MKSWEARVERLIREAQERGEFDNLPGAGKPIEGLDKPHDSPGHLRRVQVGHHDAGVVGQGFLSPAGVGERDDRQASRQCLEIDQGERVLTGRQEEDVRGELLAAAPLAAQAREVVGLAGGSEVVAARARKLVDTDLRLATHLADWTFYADPEDPVAQQLILDTYKARILDPASNVQERLAYIDQMVAARARQLARD